MPRVEYAWNGDIALAYQVVGEGPVDLLYTDGWCSNAHLAWEGPLYGRFLRGLAEGVRFVFTDRRGFGLSDRFSPDDVPPLETLVDDLLAVLDAAGSERAVIMGTWQSGFLATMFAAAHPERTAGLVLCAAFPTYSATEATPWLPTVEEWLGPICDDMRDSWGTAPYYQDLLSAGEDLEWMLRWGASSVAPGALISETRQHVRTDLRGILPSVYVPTLVLQDEDGTYIQDPRSAQYLADHIAGARLVAYQGAGEMPWQRGAAAIVRAVHAFIDELEADRRQLDRVLATVLFTDIVASTERAAALGDRGWRQLVEEHHLIVRAMLARFRGVEVDTAGDGFFATFDGPARAVRCAEAIENAVRPLGIEVRAGVHTGEVETIGGKAGGLAVVIGARIGALAGPSEVLASQTVKDLTAGAGLALEDAGEHALKGVPGRWHLHRVASTRAS